jgi:serine/threonine protein kinase
VTAVSQLNPGQVFGRYELLLPIAQGGMASVWAARLHGTRGFRKLVAIKTILQGGMDNARLERMFLDEATLAAQIHHSNVVETLELGEHDGTLFLVMEWVDGEPLSHLVRASAESGGIPLPIAVNLIGQACKGLHAAHDARDDRGHLIGLVHRDISPQNVLVNYSGQAKLVDFGIAKATQRSSSLTEDGEVKGKLGYMAPEQIRGQVVDRRTDIFALGTLLYLLTTGKNPFKGENAAETMQNISSANAVAPPSTVMEGYPADLEWVVSKALEKSPNKRFATAFEMLQALERALPTCFDAGFEAEVASFINRVSGARGQDRRKRIALAGELLDRARADGAPAEFGSQSSLSAIAIDRPPVSTTHPSMPQVALVSDSEIRPQRSRRGKLGMIGAAAAGFVGIGLVFGVSLGQREPASSVPASGGPQVSPSIQQVREAQQKVLPPAVSLDSLPPLPSVGDGGAGAAGLARRKRAPAVRAPSARAAVAVPARSEGAAPSAPAAPQPSAKRAWDPSTFGGRY